MYWNPELDFPLKRFLIKSGDVLVSMTGANIGMSSRVRDVDVPAILNQRVGRFIVHDSNALNSSYLFLFTQSPLFVKNVQELAIGMAQANISSSSLESICIPLPPLAEQELIVTEVERRLSIVSELESIVEVNLKRAERLRQSILERAFAGKLVPQHPDDEPASVLLERIREQREGSGPVQRDSRQLDSNSQNGHQDTAAFSPVQDSLWRGE